MSQYPAFRIKKWPFYLIFKMAVHKQHKFHRSSKVKSIKPKSPSLSNPVKTIDRYIPERKNLTKSMMCFCGKIQIGNKISQIKEFLSNKFSSSSSYTTIEE